MLGIGINIRCFDLIKFVRFKRNKLIFVGVLWLKDRNFFELCKKL